MSDSELFVIKCRIYGLLVAKLCTAGAMVVDKYVRWVGQVDG